ncbi:MAG: glucose-1-phosphate adenylyltransferase [Omnitrophica bacterium RIFCSPHIGHO2_02_FULL_51_18]|nr:MAG: glucose-1-phosphate adenylyltransferase [Omnitrophica bacterium RIFCSPHIGHO2_02_FULL_51_18]
MKKLLTFVMAGGKGERLHPLTKDRAKPAVPFGGIYRIIDFTLSNCVNSGIRRIHILVQYKSLSLARHIRMGWNVLASEVGEYVDVVPAQQRIDEHWYQGTADSIYQNLYSIQIENPDQVLILAGDHIYKMNYKLMLDRHRQSSADLTIGVVPVPKEEGSSVGVIEVDESNNVIGFEEKPKAPKTIPGDAESIYGSMGIYIFDRKALEEELKEDAHKDTAHDFGKNIIPQMIQKGKRKIVAFQFVDLNNKEVLYWRDVGTLDAYYEANMDLVQVSPHFNLYDREWPIRTYQLQYPPAKFVFAQVFGGRRGEALDSLVADGGIVSGGMVQGSILSPNVRVNSYAEVENSLLLEGVDVGRYAKIKNAIIDKHVKVMPNARIGYELEKDRKKFTVTPKGIVVVEKGAVVEAD